MKQKGWFSENFIGIIAIATLIFSFGVILIILLRQVKTTDTTTTIILTGTFNMLMVIMGYCFISSKTSKDKDKVISDMSGT